MPSAITKGANKDQNENNSAPNTWGGVHFARSAAAPLFAGGLQQPFVQEMIRSLAYKQDFAFGQEKRRGI